MSNQSVGSTIVAFHIGRGGQFHNAGHTTFLGEHSIKKYITDLFTTTEKYGEVFGTIQNHDNVVAEFERLRDEDDYAGMEKLANRFGMTLGEVGYADFNGNFIITKKDVDSGIGRIDLDGQYDTTYTCRLEDCSEAQLRIIYNDRFTSSKVKAYIKEYFATLGEELA